MYGLGYTSYCCAVLFTDASGKYDASCFKIVIFERMLQINFIITLYEITHGLMPQNILSTWINFGLDNGSSLGVMQQQATTWANADPDLCCSHFLAIIK